MRKESVESSDDELLSEIFKYNPIISAQANNNYIFEADFWLGHGLLGTSPREDEYGPKGEFVGQDGYVSFRKILREVRDKGRLIINFGDSSTSGWDSGQVGNSNPLFQYKTYSDVLRDFLGEDFVVVNAGVPGYSSLQGLRRARQILDWCKKAGISIDYATIYLGNNDSVYNGNVQEKDALPTYRDIRLKEKYQRSLKDAVEIVKTNYQRAVRKALETFIIPRVFPGDYKRNLKTLLRLLKRENTVPILIEPVTPLYWMPGRRIAEAEKAVEEFYVTSNALATKQLWRARGIYETALKFMTDPAMQREALEKALELDRVCPRISRPYREALWTVAEKENTSLICTAVNHSQVFDSANFVDYTHPRGELNVMIADGIAKKIAEVESDRMLREKCLKIDRDFLIKDPEPSDYQQSLLRQVEMNRTTFSAAKQVALSVWGSDEAPNMYTVRMPEGANRI
uniref:Lysophospholipase L1 n=1 Tax=Candidatus Kentrum sp. FW TaxID=2126338 RepID=A0A450SLP5_9GAMM|nr:MAG: Lysophospholipase L1 [Candidatus Kentron sp. FW]VFJ54690.1 MAG: Lysophospholipase L1 [Candidatus Kentron sp. FW]VFJ72453.1 MAG: Lysophospholipase L1 [Candidatus Kentron sp. FW]